MSIAAKTGTAETSNLKTTDPDYTEPNLSFICYAPANDPEIAIAVMMEHGNSGNYAKNVAKDILDQYFGFYTWDEDGNKFDQNGNQVDDSGVIIKTAEEIAEEQAQQEGASQAQQGTAMPPLGQSPPPPPRPPRTGAATSPIPPSPGERQPFPQP